MGSRGKILDLTYPYREGILRFVWLKCLSFWEKHAPRYLEYYNKHKMPVSKFGYAIGFDKALVASEAVRIAVATVGPDKVTGEAVYNALQKINGFDAFGLGPAHSFSATKRYGQSSVYMFRLNNNKINYLAEQTTPNLTDVK